MKRQDARKLDHTTLETLRKRAVKAVLAGKSPEDVAVTIGVHRGTLYAWLLKHKNGGMNALTAKPIPGRKAKVQKSGTQWLYECISKKSPSDFGFESNLWTRAIIQELIFKTRKMKLSPQSVGRLLAKMGITCQKPLHKAIEQNPKLVKQWISDVFPKIKRLAKSEKANIYFGDASHLRSDFHSGTSWDPCGKTPVVKRTGNRFGFSVISAITNKGHMRFVIIEGGVNSDQFISFLKRLLFKSKNKTFLIVDNGPAHRSKKTKEFVKSVRDKLRLFYLPPYSPELNPDELVWNDLKNNTVGKSSVTTKNDFKKLIHKSMKMMKPAKIASFFRKKSCSYAA